MSRVLQVLGEYHNEWIAIARSRGAGQDAEDCVQDMYIKVYESKKSLEQILFKNGEPNKLFIWMVINSVVTDMLRRRTTAKHAHHNTNREEIDLSYLEASPMNRAEQDAFNKMFDMATAAIDELHWYDKKLSKIYFGSDMSMRNIADETGISLRSIFDSLKKIKGHLREKLGEDYEDYINGDYDKL